MDSSRWDNPVFSSSPASSLHLDHVPVPAIVSSPPSPTPDQDITEILRPPTPHRGFSLRVPGAPPAPHLLRRRTSSTSRADSEKASNAATRGNSDNDEEAEVESQGLCHMSSRETMRTMGSRGRPPPSPALTAASASPIDFHDIVQIYQIVASRRATFDGLLWSVPSTSFAAQAFLFQTALAGNSAQSSRIIAMALSVLITVLTLQLFTRQLQAEAADHAWLEDWEKRHNVDPQDRAHGETWNSYRSVLPKKARHFAFLASIRGFTLWSNGML
ncbi:hypothetical protein JCM1840_007528 [Sporobolomyces johnsonii]